MENASKALIMAATVLLGVMIISVGVTLFKTFSDFSADTAQKMQEKQISEWNNTYLKYYGKTEYLQDEDNPNSKKIITPIRVTAHDIVSVINSARQNNIYYFQNDWPINPNENYYYVRVLISGNIAGTWDENEKLEFLKNNSLDENNKPIYFACEKVDISSVTKRVYKITFKKQ